ncbi:hypothetical protein GLOTRDRAFT_131773 [Gloeophyllum trabeum ATCC 11539]|uniref:Uncharacterized protein n=1 Tax=Gloeophyllum trabeum (strain ATCC 11539 / FP-39264 / Madison 617) TaxID=670483 RepID=S7PZ36_GLOTA|nr:uncharacterized protein GLOTRDRAFT_131773 [Gloeophyllum trabeum ATCC 11539]EPQ52537.1 hypothetical protein GLOTRDRAFT_131773 [Gloeophyllum trabeum ATCC 11539]
MLCASPDHSSFLRIPSLLSRHVRKPLHSIPNWPSPHHNKCTEPSNICSYPNPPQPVKRTYACQGPGCSGTYTVSWCMARKADGYYREVFRIRREVVAMGAQVNDSRDSAGSEENASPEKGIPRPTLGDRSFSSMDIPRRSLGSPGLCRTTRQGVLNGYEGRWRKAQEYLEDQIEQQLYPDKKVRQRWYGCALLSVLGTLLISYYGITGYSPGAGYVICSQDRVLEALPGRPFMMHDEERTAVQVLAAHLAGMKAFQYRAIKERGGDYVLAYQALGAVEI